MKKVQELAILATEPSMGVPGGELTVACRGFIPGLSSKVYLGPEKALIVSASEERVIVKLPESPKSLGLVLEVEGKQSQLFPFNLAVCLASDLHPVTSPVVDSNGGIITTISGSRGEQVAQPLIRVTKRGDKIAFNCEIMNPTGLALSKDGQLYISSRSEGTVMRYTDYEHLEVVAEDLGIPCGLAFDSKGLLYVGDRTGRIYRIDLTGNREEFARLEPSISAYHLAVDAEDRLYVTGPTFALRDSLIRISQDGKQEVLIRGLARPQGMAFLPDGDLLIATGYQGKKGIFRYSPSTGSFKHYITGPILVGLAVSGSDIYLASNNAIYWLQVSGQSAVN